jgi:hypothetical protein
VAKQHSQDAGRIASEPQPPRSDAFVMPSAALVIPSAVNDNEAPLHLKLRRLGLVALTGLAVGWLFWVGLLR